MKTFLVGGAVRDQLLDRPVTERDYVVVGANPTQMLALGFLPVGRDFPVFLHPQTKEEYALARTERKSGSGYHGFTFHADEEVSLEQDLQRRDLTVNAMAIDETGTIVDPYGGQRDLSARILRHVSPAFGEDPLRVLRVARFAARYHPLGFRVAPETLQLMREIAQSGELAALTPERVWMEIHKTLKEANPDVFIEVLRECGALAILLPEIHALYGVPNPAQWHPEIDTGIHTMMVLRIACILTDNSRVRFAALVHDLGKGVTPSKYWPSHRGHEEAGVPIIEQLCDRLRIPNDFRDLAVLTSRFHLHFHRAFILRPGTILKVLMQTDALRRPERFLELISACESDYRGREGWHERAYPQRSFWQETLRIIREVPVQPLLEQGFKGQTLADKLFELRVQAIAELRTRLAHDSTELA